MSRTLPTCHQDGCDRPAVVSTITRQGVVGPGCLQHVFLHPGVERKRDTAAVDTYRTESALDRAETRDWLTDLAVEYAEHHQRRPVVAIEVALVYRVVCDDGAVHAAAVTPTGQATGVGKSLLGDLAPRIASRIEQEVAGDE